MNLECAGRVPIHRDGDGALIYLRGSLYAPERPKNKSKAASPPHSKSGISSVNTLHLFQEIAAIDQVVKLDGFGDDHVWFGLSRFRLA